MPKVNKEKKMTIYITKKRGETMENVGRIILDLCEEFQTQLYIALLTITLLGVGAGFMISAESAEKTKKRLPYILLGAIIAAGAITLGAKYGAQFKF